MSRYLSNRDGGKTDEAGHLRFLNSLTTGDVFSGGVTTQNGVPNMSVNVSAIDAIIRDTGNGYAFHAWSDAMEVVTIATANVANPRKDYIIAYVDKGEDVSDEIVNNPNIWKLISVAGTPAGSPAVPTVPQIQASAVGTNPYIILATVTVSTGTSTITNGSIVDGRALVSAARVESSKIDYLNSSGSYSTSEVATPHKWIDGKTIYKKTIAYGTLPNSTSKSVAHGISNLSRVMDIQTEVYEASGHYYYKLGHVNVNALTTQISMYLDDTSIVMQTGTNRTGLTANVTVFYTKTS